MNSTQSNPVSTSFVENNKYIHQMGQHCESACQKNILLTHGLALDESIIFGLDGSFGFSFYNSPGSNADIIIGKQSIFPLQAARLMGVEVKTYKQAGTSFLVELLEQFQVVMTRVDISYLPQWKLKGNSAFGGYFINVIEFDQINRQFKISDPAFDTEHWVDEEVLAKARSSKNSPPINPNNLCYVFSPPKRQPKLALVGPVAVRNLCREMLNPNFLNLGLPGIKKLRKASKQWESDKKNQFVDIDLNGTTVKSDGFTAQLVYLGKQIEVFGTGGGLFRPMISKYLTQVGKATGNELYIQAAIMFKESGTIWQNLGERLLAIKEHEISTEHLEIMDELSISLGKIMTIEKSALEAIKSL